MPLAGVFYYDKLWVRALNVNIILSRKTIISRRVKKKKPTRYFEYYTFILFYYYYIKSSRTSDCWYDTVCLRIKTQYNLTGQTETKYLFLLCIFVQNKILYNFKLIM
jgi:hypothetical protein